MNRMTVLACLLAAFALASAAQVSSVPIEKEPMHRLKLENEFVRVFDVLIPRGKSSLFHTHLYDGLSIRLSDSQVTEEVIGGGKPVTEIKYGEAVYGPRSSPMTHSVTATGKRDFRNIFIELLSHPAAPSRPIPPLSDGPVILIDNARVRVNRLVLKPGESSKPHTHTLGGLGIILYDSRIEISAPGAAPRVMDAKAGDFVWQTAGTAHTIKNTGTTVFEAIDVEIK